MKKIFIVSILVLIFIVISGCQVGSPVCPELDYSKCPQTKCPDLDCSECPKQIETKTENKYQCYDGSTKTKLSDCSNPEEYLKEMKRTTFDIDDARTKAMEFVNGDYSIEELTKFTINGNTLNIEFSHSNWVENIMKKGIFDFVKKEANYLKSKDKELDLQITATSAMGGYLKCTTDWSDLLKVANLEMGYEDWKSSASCSQNGLY